MKVFSTEISLNKFNKNRIFKIFFFIVLFTALPVFIKGAFWLHILILIFMYGALGSSWNFIGGYTGQVSFMQAVFFGIGAYTSSVLSTKYGVSPWLGMFVGGFISVIFSSALGVLVFRLRGHYFAISTIAIGEIVNVLIRRWNFVGGATGLYIPMKEEGLINFQFHSSKVGYYYIFLGLILFATLLTYLVQRSKLGYYFQAIRENDIAASSVGIDVPKFKVIAFGLSAFIAAFAGTCYAQYVLYIDPESLIILVVSLQIVFVTILGGSGTIIGPLVGAILLIVFQQFTTVYLGSERAVHMLLYGALIVLIEIFEPDGLVAIYNRLYKKVVERYE